MGVSRRSYAAQRGVSEAAVSETIATEHVYAWIPESNSAVCHLAMKQLAVLPCDCFRPETRKNRRLSGRKTTTRQRRNRAGPNTRARSATLRYAHTASELRGWSRACLRLLIFTIRHLMRADKPRYRAPKVEYLMRLIDRPSSDKK